MKDESCEKMQWINKNGSEELKKMAAKGSDTDVLYVIERAASEFPGYRADIEDSACFGSRMHPDIELTAEAEKIKKKGHNAFVAWLTEPISDPDENEDNFIPRETIIIENYLGICNLVKQI